MKNSTIFLLLILFSSCTKNQSIRSVLIDGQINTNEWKDAKSILIDEQNTLFIKEDQHYLYLAIKSSLSKPLYTDLFLATSDSLFNIHASSQLGDRILNDTIWDDYHPETKWGFNRGWIANTVRFDRPRMAKLRAENFEGDLFAATHIPYDGMEFQLDKSVWKLSNSKLRLEIRSMIGPEGFETVAFPENTTRKDQTNWYELKVTP